MRISDGWKHAARAVSREHVLSLVDQAVVNGSGFLTRLMIARWAGPEQLGVYAVGFTILLSLMTFQESLILEPYTIQRHYPEGTPAERTGSSLVLSFFFSAAVTLIAATVALFFLLWDVERVTVVIAVVIAGITPFVLTREFTRRVAFARLDVGGALFLDLTVAVIQICALYWLGTTGRMSAVGAWFALGGACAVAAAIWLYLARSQFVVRMHRVRTVFKRAWPLGRWLLAGQITVQVQGSIAYWLLAAIAGTAATGVYAACMSIVSLANPLLLGFANVLMPRSVLAWRNKGAPGLWREAVRSAVMIGALLGAFCLVILLAGDDVLRFIFRGQAFAGNGRTLTVLALATLAGALSMPASYALATMERPRAIVAIGALSAAVAVILVWVLTTEWGLLGAAFGLLGANVVSTIGRWIALSVLVSQVQDLAPQVGQYGHQLERPTTLGGG